MPISSSSRLAARQRSRDAAFLRTRSNFGIYAASWPNLTARLADWQAVCKAFFTMMMVCAFCGVVHLGQDAHWYSKIPARALAPSLIANSLMDDFATHAGCYILCPSCMKRGQRSNYNPYVEVSYMQSLLSIPPMSMQLMSLLDVSLKMFQGASQSHALYSFTKGVHEARSLLQYPLVAWKREIHGVVTAVVPQAFTEILQSNLRTNPLVKYFKTIFEMPHDAQNIPVVLANFVESVVRRARDRGPLVDAETDLMPYAFSAAIDHSPYLPSVSGQVFHTGHLHFRHAPASLRSDAQATHLLEVTDNLVPIGTPPPQCPALTVESALFPHLFPHGKGAFDGKVAFHYYLQQRANMLFSIFGLTIQHPQPSQTTKKILLKTRQHE